MATRTVIMIIIAFYLVGLGFLLPAINNAIVIHTPSNQVLYSNDSRTITTQDSTRFNFITTITSLPLWFNTIFIIFPLVVFIVLGIVALIPTVNAGA